MTPRFTSSVATNSAALEIDLAAIPAHHVVSGNPRSGSAKIGTFADIEVGIWEHSAGTSTDIEVDEVFIVISGSATIDFINPKSPSLTVVAGDVVRLTAGTQTRWTVPQKLRKIYLVVAD